MPKPAIIVYGGNQQFDLDDLGDTTITSVADGEVIVYDSSSSKWINQTLNEAQTYFVPTSGAFTIPSGKQLIVYGSFEATGELVVEGDLVIL